MAKKTETATDVQEMVATPTKEISLKEVKDGIKKKTFDIGAEMLKPVGLDKFGIKVYKGDVI